MSIKPIDFQVMFPKTAEVSKIINDENQRNHAAQQQQANSIQNRAENSVRQVHSQDKPQEARIKEKQEKEQQAGKKGKNKKQDKDTSGKNEQKSRQSEQKSIIDIRL